MIKVMLLALALLFSVGGGLATSHPLVSHQHVTATHVKPYCIGENGPPCS